MGKYSSIAVIYGSDSSEWEVSCRSGEFVASRIDGNEYDVYEIFARFGRWQLVAFKKKNAMRVTFPEGSRPEVDKTDFSISILGEKVNFDYAYIVQHGAPGESGELQGNLDDGDWQRLAIAAEALKDTQLYFDDTSGITANEMKAKIRRMKDVDMVVIDYLQLMKSATRIDSRVQEVSEITRSLKLMAKDLNIPVVVLAQLSRGTEGHGQKSHRPQLADLRESGSIEQDADIVIMLYREDYYANDPDVPVDMDKQIDTVDLIVAKNRHGPTETVTLGWNAEFTLFSAIEKKFDDQF